MKKVEIVIIILLIFMFSVAVVPKTFQNDTFFTIAIGEKILNDEDVNSLTFHEDVNFLHSGYFDIVLDSIYRFVGFNGIYAFVILFVFIIGILYFSIANEIFESKIFSLIITLFVLYISRGAYTARAQIISFTLYVFELYSLNKLRNTGKIRYIVYLGIISLLIANFHASVFLIYYVIYIPYLIEYFCFKFNLTRFFNGKIVADENNNFIKMCIALGLGVVLSFVNPTFIEPYIDMFYTIGGISSKYIGELQSSNILSNSAFIYITIIPIVLYLCTDIKINVRDLLYIVGFAILGISTNRCMYFYYFISTISIIRVLKQTFDMYKCSLNITDTKAKKIIYAILILGMIVYLTSCVLNNQKVDYVDEASYPVGATEFILENVDIQSMRIYNHFNFGSYLEYKGIPVFIDSRSGMFTEQFNEGVTVLEDFFNVSVGTEHYSKLFDKYNITHALLYNGELVDIYLSYDSNWNKIYQDDYFSLYEKVN